MKYVVVLLIGLFLGCSSEPQQSGRFEFNKGNTEVPDFDSDSAYKFIESQLSFGTREPNSSGHKQTRDYLINILRSYAGQNGVYAQDFQIVGYNDELLELTNVIAAFNPSAKDRILLAAHWDTRPRAEEDKDPSRHDEPIFGADDGGSGVGVLLELARIFSVNNPPIGVDIILFDGEDYGVPSDLNNYFLGARHWSSNPPVPGYSPRFGILLDMVGGKGATFPKEGFSRRYAPELVNNVWDVADELGYQDYFLNVEGPPVADDHLVVNQLARIPMIDIIHYTSTNGETVEFPPYWHTHDDTIEIIDKSTLDAVGSILLEVIYNRLN